MSPPTSSAINFMCAYSALTQKARKSAIILTNILHKETYTTAHKCFLTTSLRHKVVPKYVINQVTLLHIPSKAVSRKKLALSLEVIGEDVRNDDQKLYELNRQKSYEWLNLNRTLSVEVLQPMVCTWQKMIA